MDFTLKTEYFTPRQIEFILHSYAKFNIAEGSVRSGKTVCVLFRFMQAVWNCPGEQIWMLGHTQETVYHNCVSPILFPSEGSPLAIFTPFLTWHKSGILEFAHKKIYTLGARDERAIGAIQGKTMDLIYCNEMTLYPESVIQMITTRLSMPHSILLADMNPVQPEHICHKWVTWAKENDPNYYSLHFSIEDNSFLSQEYKDNLKKTLTGIFYRRNYLGEWCLAEGAIFDFFDKNIHVSKHHSYVDFWVAGIDYGAANAFACVILGVKEAKYGNDAGHIQVQAEYYYDPKDKRTKTNSELCRDLMELFKRYPVKSVYLDPSAASFRAELRLNGIHTADTDNEVLSGITLMTAMVGDGQVDVYQGCKNLIREMEGYCWDSKASAKGWDEPLKQNDHACDALRYALVGHMRGRTTLRQAGPPKSSAEFGRGLGQINNDRFQASQPQQQQSNGQWRMT